jgi:hypothetical protein
LRGVDYAPIASKNYQPRSLPWPPKSASGTVVAPLGNVPSAPSRQINAGASAAFAGAIASLFPVEVTLGKKLINKTTLHH